MPATPAQGPNPSPKPCQEFAKQRPDPDGNGIVQAFDGVYLSPNATVRLIIDRTAESTSVLFKPNATDPGRPFVAVNFRKWRIEDEGRIYTVELLNDSVVFRGGWRRATLTTHPEREGVFDVFEFNDFIRPWLTGARLFAKR